MTTNSQTIYEAESSPKTGSQSSNGRDSGEHPRPALAAVDQDTGSEGNGVRLDRQALEKGVAPAESGSAGATRNQPVASTKGVSDIKVTPVIESPATRVSHRINPDDRRFILVVTTGVVIAGLVAFAISFVALMEVAAWLGLPWWMHWAVPTFIDLAILVYAASVLVHKARGEATWKSWVMLAAFTGLSVVANVAHALSYQQQAPWQSIIGAVIAGMVPFAIFAATDQLASVAVEDPETRRSEIEAQERWLAQQARLEQERLEREHERELAREERQRRKEEHEAGLELRRAENEVRVQAVRDGKLSFLEAAGSSHSVQDTPWAGSSPSPASRGMSTSGAGTRTGVPKGQGPSEAANGRRDPAPVEEVADLIQSRTRQGLETTKHDVVDHFGLDPEKQTRTCYRRIKDLRVERPEIFLEGDR